MDDMVIISVDDHAIEPPEAFIRHYPEGKKDQAPRIVQGHLAVERPAHSDDRAQRCGRPSA
jgi:hypothetical protein